MTLYLVPARALLNIRAMHKYAKYNANVKSFYCIGDSDGREWCRNEKEAERMRKLWEHLDYFFMRRNFLGKPHAWILGKTVYGAIKRTLGVQGKSYQLLLAKGMAPPPSLGLFFPESCIEVDIAALKLQDGRQTLVAYEYIRAGCEGAAIFTASFREFVEKIPKQRFQLPELGIEVSKEEGFPILVGGLRRKGYGLVVLRHREEQKIEAPITKLLG
jgi:hypothetical protein